MTSSYCTIVWPHRTNDEEACLRTLLATNVSNSSGQVPRNCDYNHDPSLVIYSGILASMFLLDCGRITVIYAIFLRAASRLHDMIFAALIRCPMRFFDTNPSGKEIKSQVITRLVHENGNAIIFSSMVLSNVVISKIYSAASDKKVTKITERHFHFSSWTMVITWLFHFILARVHILIESKIIDAVKVLKLWKMQIGNSCAVWFAISSEIESIIVESWVHGNFK